MTGTTLSYSGIIGPGQTLPLSLTGTNFYFPTVTLPVFARPTGGAFCQYVQGTGLEVPAGFSGIEINNPNAVPVTFQIFAGFADFIDHRIVANLNVQAVVNPTALAAWVDHGAPFGYTLTVPDLSGTQFTDASGKLWTAIVRTSLSFQSGSSAATVVAVGANLGEVGFQQILSIPANSTEQFVFPASGNFYFQQGADNSAEVFEIYQAVAPGFAGNPPS
jgi:hypothetical protein